MEAATGKSLVMRYIKWLGKNVTAVYVVQWLIIGNIATAIYRTQYPFSLILWFLVIITVSSILTYFYARINIRRTD
jgi:ABC-type iron transport system FetAB permease component